jgi:hypothetical protein
LQRQLDPTGRVTMHHPEMIQQIRRGELDIHPVPMERMWRDIRDPEPNPLAQPKPGADPNIQRGGV